MPVRQWLRAAFKRRALDREMREEMQRHIDLTTQRLIERGMRPGDARWAARREFGNLASLEEEGRDARGAIWVASVSRDLRYALRALKATPAFTTVAVLSLAIGIGANTAIFSLIDAVMLKSLPVARPAELVQLWLKNPTEPSKPGSGALTNPLWEQLRDQAGTIAMYAVSAGAGFDLADGGEMRPAFGRWVNGDYFRTLGVRPAGGRLLATADDYRGCPGTAAISYAFWQSEFGGRTDVVGKPISLSGHRFTIVGVTAPGFFGVDVGQATQIYAPLCAEAIVKGKASSLDRRSAWWIRILARPKTLASLTQLNAKLRTVSSGIMATTVPQDWDAKEQADYRARYFGATSAGNGLSVLRTQYSTALLVLMGMVGIILLISCANVANLLLARGAARSREMAIRIAIGASRGRLMRQFLTESVLLAIAGGLLGVVMATWGSRLLVRMLGSAATGGIALDLSLDLRVMGFTGALGIATVVLFGLAPAWRATRVDPQSAMKSGGRGTVEGHSRFRVGKALVVAQSALALVLVVSAGLLVATFRELTTMDPGFKSEGVVIAAVGFRRTPVPPSQYSLVQSQLLAHFRAIPGVRAASVGGIVPVGGSSWNDYVVTDGFKPLSDEDRTSWFNEVSDGYFRTMNTPILAGRDFGREDNTGSTRVAVVSRTVVNHFFHGISPLGKVFSIELNGRVGPPITVVGVVADAKYETLREAAQPVIYLPSSQDTVPSASATYLLSATAPPATVIARVKTLAAEVDPQVSLAFTTMSEQVANSLQRERVLAVLSGFFGFVALLLAMIGLYGVMAYSVARRRVEIGIRIALGAARTRVVRLVLGDVARLITIGIVIGAAGAFAATRLLATFLFGVTASDPRTLAAAAVLLAAAALVAGAIPAGRAAKLEPVEALRED